MTLYFVVVVTNILVAIGLTFVLGALKIKPNMMGYWSVFFSVMFPLLVLAFFLMPK